MTANVPGTSAHIGYVPALDGLRAVAVCAVLLFHIGGMSEQGWVPGGWAGVDVFFVLSGYLITANLKREIEATGTLHCGLFYLRRTLRLSPALWVMLSLVVASPLIFEHKLDVGSAVGFALTYSMNWARAFGITNGHELGHIWSLATEEQFYLLWPVLFLILSVRMRVPVLCVGIITEIAWRALLCFSGADPERTYNGFDTHSEGLLLGCLLALLPQRAWYGVAARWYGIPCAALGFVFAFLSRTAPLTQSLGLTFVALLAAWVIIAIRENNPASRVLSARVPVFIGKISYSLYLWHFPIFVVLKPMIPHLAVPKLLLASFAAAITSYYFVERPFLRLKSKFEPSASTVSTRFRSVSSASALPLGKATVAVGSVGPTDSA